LPPSISFVGPEQRAVEHCEDGLDAEPRLPVYRPTRDKARSDSTTGTLANI